MCRPELCDNSSMHRGTKADNPCHRCRPCSSGPPFVRKRVSNGLELRIEKPSLEKMAISLFLANSTGEKRCIQLGQVG